MSKNRSTGPGIGTFFIAMIIVSIAIPLWRWLMKPEALPPLESPLKGFSTAAELEQRISQNLPQAAVIFAHDKTRFYLAAVLTVITSIVLIAATVKLRNKAKLIGGADQSIRRAHISFRLGAIAISAFVVYALFSNHLIRSRAASKWCSNANTTPLAVSPGQQVTVQFDYTPQVNAIQGRHSFRRLELANVQSQRSDGSTQEVVLTPVSGSGGSSLNSTETFSKVLPEIAVRPSITFTIPPEPGLEGSLLTGEVHGEVEYAAWASTDRWEIRSAAVSGHFAFWVAHDSQARIALLADAQYQSGLMWIFMPALLSCALAIVCGESIPKDPSVRQR